MSASIRLYGLSFFLTNIPSLYAAKISCLPEAEVRCDVAQPRSRTAIGDLEAGHTGTLVVYSVITGLVNNATVWGVLKE